MIRSLVIVILVTLLALPFIILLLLMAVVFFAPNTNKKTIVTLSALACPACGQIYGVEAAQLAQQEYIDHCQETRTANPGVLVHFVRFWVVRCPNCQTTARYYYQTESLETQGSQISDRQAKVPDSPGMSAKNEQYRSVFYPLQLDTQCGMAEE